MIHMIIGFHFFLCLYFSCSSLHFFVFIFKVFVHLSFVVYYISQTWLQLLPITEWATSPTQHTAHLFWLTKLWALSQRLACHVSSCLTCYEKVTWGAFLYDHHNALFGLSCHVPPGSEVSMETIRSDSTQAACAGVWVGTGRCGEEPVLTLQHLKSGDLSHTHTHIWTSFLLHSKPLWTECAPLFFPLLRTPLCLNQPAFCPSLVNLQPKCLLSCLQANPRPLSGREAVCSTQPLEVSGFAQKQYGFIKVCVCVKWKFDGIGSLHVHFSSYIQYFIIFLCRFLLTFDYFVANVQKCFSYPASA